MNPVKVDETTTRAKEASAGTKRALKKSMRNVQEPVLPRHEMVGCCSEGHETTQ